MFVTVDNIHFSYAAGTSVLRDVSFKLEKGETLAVVGASGCGKSTLLRIISGILPQSKNHSLAGRVSVNGLSPDEYRRTGKLAFMFQESTLMPNLSVRDNIAFPLRIKGISDDQKVTDLLDAVGLTEFAAYLPNRLSGGMKTRVALARSFVTGAELLLLDEPFAALDIAWKSKLYRELEKLLDLHHTTVVFVTHDVQEALLLSDDVLVLSKEGSIKATYEIDSDKSISARVNDISGYMAEVYADYMLPIQDSIMNGSTSGTLSNAVQPSKNDQVFDKELVS
jgi:ABC-type nitrate/sulfonate/bicarbonate transport system ATPase subunit